MQVAVRSGGLAARRPITLAGRRLRVRPARLGMTMAIAYLMALMAYGGIQDLSLSRRASALAQALRSTERQNALLRQEIREVEETGVVRSLVVHDLRLSVPGVIPVYIREKR